MKPEQKDDNIPIDYSTLNESTGGDESFMEEVLDLYQKDFSEKYQQLQKAIEVKDFTMIRELGHGLKGASANLGLTYLQESASQMELAGEENNIDIAEKMFNLLGQEFQRLKDHLSSR